MQLISLGQNCAPQFAIKYSFNQRGITSPFAWCFSNIKDLSEIISNNYKPLLNKEKIIPTKYNNKKIPELSTYGIRWIHEPDISEDIAFEKFYSKLEAQVDFVRGATFEEKESCGFIISSRKMYDKVEEPLNELRKVIPAHHKVLFCSYSNNINSPVKINNNIYTANMHSNSFSSVNSLSARRYGKSELFANIIRKAFEINA